MSNVERMARALCDVMNAGPFECCGQCADARKIATAALACAREIAEEAVSVHPTQGPMPAKGGYTAMAMAHNDCRAAVLAALTPEGNK